MSLIQNSTNTRSLLGDSLLEVLALGTTDGLPSKILVEVRCKNPAESFRNTSVGTGQGKFPVQAVNPYEYDDGDWRYDYKIVDDTLVIESSITGGVLDESGNLKITYKVDIGGGVTHSDWWQTESVLVEIERIDLLTSNNVTVARHQPSQNFSYSNGLVFDFIIEISASEIDDVFTIDDEWLIILADVLDGQNPMSTLKVDNIEYYSEDDTLLTDKTTNDTSTELVLIPVSHDLFDYSGITDSVRPDGIPSKFKIKTEQDVVIYEDDFSWSPEWLAGDTIVFTYSI